MQPYQKAGEIFSKAFLQYPLMQYAFEGKTEQQKSKGLLNLYTHCAKGASVYGNVIVNPDEEGALIWLPGKCFPLGLPREIKSGMAAIPFKLGLKSTLRLMMHDAVPEGWIREHAGEKMGYIWVVGVLARSRGKGLSRKLIEQSIEQMKQQNMNEFWLKTEDQKNVAIYQKLGFILVNEMQVKSSGLRSWVLKRT